MNNFIIIFIFIVMENSVLERLSDDQLNKYITYFNKITQDMSYRDLGDFYDNIMYNDQLSNKLRIPLGVRDLERLDIEYIYYLLENNPEGGPYTRRPQLETKTVGYVTEERKRVRYTRTGDIETYVTDAVDEGYLNSIRGDDYIDPWEWDVTDEDERDSDLYDDWFEV
jgi:hypothetical protein